MTSPLRHEAPAMQRPLSAFWAGLKKINQAGTTMQVRLFGFFLLFLVIIMLGIFMVLLATGVFSADHSAQKQLLSNELSHTAQSVYQDFGTVSVQSVALSESLREVLERSLGDAGVVPAELAQHPECLDSLLADAFPHLLAGLSRVKSSGVFLILNATINPALENAHTSRAGLYFKNLEPNIISDSSPYIHLQRGPASLARDNSIRLQSQWTQEFDVTDADYFYTPLETAQQTTLPLSRLYYWSAATMVCGTSEDVLLCSVPLIASDGSALGVCGFEISAMLFKMSYSAQNQSYPNLFYAFSPVQGLSIIASQGVFAGNRGLYAPLKNTDLTLKADGDFYAYEADNGEMYAGLHIPITLYPADSPFASNNRMLTLLLPQQDLFGQLAANRWKLIGLLGILMLLSVIGAVVLSKRYISPVVRALSLVKSQDLSELPRTRIPEIDDLIEFLSRQDDAPPISECAEASPFVADQYQTFLQNVKTLSMAERAVFDLYMEGHTAKEITEILCLSINTIKTHNRRIYAKLNVSSRKELMAYVQQMEDAQQREKRE